MATDPACGMEVDPLTSSITAEYDGQLYHFCSDGCKEQFKNDPQRFVEAALPALDKQDGVTTSRLASESTSGTFELHTHHDDRVDVGDEVTLTKTITEADVERFAALTSDTNALHLNERFASRTRFGSRIVHGTLVSGLISAALASLPGITIYLSQSLEFHGPVFIGETVTARCRIDDQLDEDKYRLTTRVENDAGTSVLDGTATVLIDELPLE
ncbi:MaoC/PaaZ C-terminal domain-containing protein [Natronorubrum thiooxidans]|uniref:Acyl dehydratase n=1 Tax=Natronorubrum thiooxidans TaxID=308853 RepID=A0A1N7GZY9_9EURY|nr:MaoC/PaaZ C-terminal domain-containing protein [Natronorubrum thiooxidans]SIS18164.1 Acyl dehydratase [Natronorubrum thiooxidans]